MRTITARIATPVRLGEAATVRTMSRLGVGLLSDHECPCLTARSGTYRARSLLRRSRVVRPPASSRSASVTQSLPAVPGVILRTAFGRESLAQVAVTGYSVVVNRFKISTCRG